VIRVDHAKVLAEVKERCFREVGHAQAVVKQLLSFRLNQTLHVSDKFCVEIAIAQNAKQITTKFVIRS
jgi:hypothetical protein